MLWHIELQFYAWLYFTILQIKSECGQFPSIFVWVMPLLGLRILEMHSFLHCSLSCSSYMYWQIYLKLKISCWFLLCVSFRKVLYKNNLLKCSWRAYYAPFAVLMYISYSIRIVMQALSWRFSLWMKFCELVNKGKLIAKFYVHYPYCFTVSHSEGHMMSAYVGRVKWFWKVLVALVLSKYTYYEFHQIFKMAYPSKSKSLRVYVFEMLHAIYMGRNKRQINRSL